jgi:formate hydrogenlyase subunit 6/NADH:ubiquinone oxidoreductase subunit I
MSSMNKIRVTDTDWRQVELPRLDETRCNGCGWCVAVCPTDCLAMRGPYPWLPRPLDCISCGLCAWICPTTAIDLG